MANVIAREPDPNPILVVAPQKTYPRRPKQQFEIAFIMSTAIEKQARSLVGEVIRAIVQLEATPPSDDSPESSGSIDTSSFGSLASRISLDQENSSTASGRRKHRNTILMVVSKTKVVFFGLSKQGVLFSKTIVDEIPLAEFPRTDITTVDTEQSHLGDPTCLSVRIGSIDGSIYTLGCSKRQLKALTKVQRLLVPSN